MTNSYIVNMTSAQTSEVDDLELSVSETGTTRKVLRAMIVDNEKAPDNYIRVTLVHQKRRKSDPTWGDLPGTTLHQTRFNEPSKFALDSAETKALYERLVDLYEIGQDGVPSGTQRIRLANEDEVIQTDTARAALIRKLLDTSHGPELWQSLVELQPTLTDRLIGERLYLQRQGALDEFVEEISGSRTEGDWNKFFSQNIWMFGGGVVKLLDDRRIDTTHHTDLPFEIDGSYMDIVELKRPDFEFWKMTRDGETYLYRGRHPIPSDELSGAMAQLDGYILQAEKKVSDSDYHETHSVRPLKPRGLVVHGRSDTWTTTEWDAFRLLNDRHHGVQVVTFDHLLLQATRIAGSTPLDSSSTAKN